MNQRIMDVSSSLSGISLRNNKDANERNNDSLEDFLNTQKMC
jgi:hypothetical protein